MNPSPNIVYLNGAYLPVEEAKISVMDRGFLFGDAVYEVVPVFGNNLLRVDEHLARLQNSLSRVSMANPLNSKEWAEIFSQLLNKNQGEDRAIYLQVSRGAYPVRDLSINKTNQSTCPATVFAMILQVKPPDMDVVSAGISVITVDDFRWHACDIKSTSLIANVMLKQQAVAANVEDAVLIRKGMVTEGTASNVFLVKDGTLLTPPTKHPTGNQLLLPGITRDLVIEIAEKNTIVVQQREIKEAELYSADEIWMTSSTREIAPVIRLNGEAVGVGIGAGVAGEMWKRVMDLYQQHKLLLRSSNEQ